MESHSISIARTIINQINEFDRWALMAFGAQNFVALEENKEFQGGVRFNVNGLKHKGTVLIQLRWVDDYTVSFVNKKNEVVKSFECVYCDMLVQILNWLEGQ